MADMKHQVLVRTSRLGKQAIELREPVPHGAPHAPRSRAIHHGRNLHLVEQASFVQLQFTR
jgi:hypothetical protein